jgi:hypothetical protein
MTNNKQSKAVRDEIENSLLNSELSATRPEVTIASAAFIDAFCRRDLSDTARHRISIIIDTALNHPVQEHAEDVLYVLRHTPYIVPLIPTLDSMETTAHEVDFLSRRLGELEA